MENSKLRGYFLNDSHEAVKDKEVLRMRMKSRRNTLTTVSRISHSKQACEQLLSLPEFQEAQTIALYASFGSELDPKLVVERMGDKRLVIPTVVSDTRMEFIEIDKKIYLDRNSWPEFMASPKHRTGIPSGKKAVPAQEIDFAVVPGLAFDMQNIRLGYGGGYYDRYLGRDEFNGFTCAIAFDDQIVRTKLPVESFDIPLHCVVTEKIIHRLED